MSNSYGTKNSLQQKSNTNVLRNNKLDGAYKPSQAILAGISFKENAETRKLAEEQAFFAKMANERTIRRENVVSKPIIVKKAEKDTTVYATTGTSAKTAQSTTKTAQNGSYSPTSNVAANVATQILEQKGKIKFVPSKKLKPEEQEVVDAMRATAKLAKETEKLAKQASKTSKEKKPVIKPEDYAPILPGQAWQSGSLPIISEEQSLAMAKDTKNNLYLVTVITMLPDRLDYQFMLLEDPNRQNMLDRFNCLLREQDKLFTKSLAWSIVELDSWYDDSGKRHYAMDKIKSVLRQKGKLFTPSAKEVPISNTAKVENVIKDSTDSLETLDAEIVE